MPSLTAASTPGGDLGRVAVEAEVLRRVGEHLVVADVRARGDTRERAAAGDRVRRIVARRRSPRRGSRAPIPSGRRGAWRTARTSRGRESAGGDHLRGRVRRVALREAGRHRVAGRVEEGVRLVDAVVDDPDLDPVARGAERRHAPHLGRADQTRAAVEQRAGRRRSARRARPPAVAPRRPSSEPGEDDGEAVEDDAVAPGDPRGRDRGRDPGGERTLRRRQRCEVADARRRAQVEALRLDAAGEHAAPC